VFVPKGSGVDFIPIAPPWPEDVDRLVQQIARATEKRIARHIREESSDEPASLLEIEQARSTEATPCPYPHSGGQSAQQSRKRTGFYFGYSLHAERHVDADDREGLERLCRYGARAPIANSRLSLRHDGKAVVELKRPFYDGRTHITLEPAELVQKLATLVPPRRKHLTRYHGVFAPAHRFRSAVVPRSTAVDSEIRSPSKATTANPAAEQATTAKPWQANRLSWADLLRRVFAIDILRCDRCGGSMSIIAVIPESPIADRILDHLGLELSSPMATGPPDSELHIH
jgi:hypothetical protein